MISIVRKQKRTRQSSPDFGETFHRAMALLLFAYPPLDRPGGIRARNFEITARTSRAQKIYLQPAGSSRLLSCVSPFLPLPLAPSFPLAVTPG